MATVELPGLSGDCLLAFLAALGALRLVDCAVPGTSLSWGWGDQWRPLINIPGPLTGERPEKAFVKLLCDAASDPLIGVSGPLCGALGEYNGNEIPALRFAELAGPVRSSRSQRLTLDMLAAMGSDGAPDKKKGLIASTELRALGGGPQKFLDTMRKLVATTTQEQIEAALFQTWRYQDERLSMRWDPLDYRPHALRALDPGNGAPPCVHGANRLAIEALPWFPVFSTRHGARTRSFRDQTNTIAWPIWSIACSATAVQSMLGLSALLDSPPDRASFELHGISQVFFLHAIHGR